MTDTVASVEATTVQLPIPRPLQLGSQVVTHRTYAIVRVRTTAGLEGHALALSRETPVADTVTSLLAPIVAGLAADDVAGAWDAMYRRTLFGGRVGTVMRAMSLVDIALWDIKGKAAGLPVWRLLRDGCAAPEVECVYVAGYPTGDGAEALGERVAEFAHEGHRLLKVARPSDPEALRRLLQRAARDLPAGAEVIVDAAWWWRDAAAAADEIRRWHDVAPLAWVEDPIVPEDVDAYVELVASDVAPIGVGDELTDRHTAAALMTRARVPVLRVDACAIGGISAAWELANLADSLGVAVSFHVYPETHIHLGAAGSSGWLVETFGPPDNPFDPSAQLYDGGPTFRPGSARATDEPGLGFTVADAWLSKN